MSFRVPQCAKRRDGGTDGPSKRDVAFGPVHQYGASAVRRVASSKSSWRAHKESKSSCGTISATSSRTPLERCAPLGALTAARAWTLYTSRDTNEKGIV